MADLNDIRNMATRLATDAIELAEATMEYQATQVVPLPNSWYQAGDGANTGQSTPPAPPPTPPPPPPSNTPAIPGFDPVAAVQVQPGQSIASLANSHPAGTQFRLLPGGHDFRDVRPKTNQHFRGDPGVVAEGTSQGYGIRARTQGESDGVVIGGIKFRNYGQGTKRGDYGAVSARDTDVLAGQWKYTPSQDWFVYDCEFERNSSNGLFMGDNMTLYRVSAYGHTVTGMGGSRIVGGLIHSCEFAANALDPATGAKANGSQVKIVWVNAHEGRTSVTPIDRTRAQLRVINSDFRATRPGINGKTSIGLWFDLDCIDAIVEDCTFDGHSSTSIEWEGCNNGRASRNLIKNSDGFGDAYNDDFMNGAINVAESTNVVVEDNTIEDCRNALVNRMSSRGADWYRLEQNPKTYVNYSHPQGGRYWITAGNPAAIPGPYGRSNHWTGKNTFRRNKLIRCDRVLINEGTNRNGHNAVGSTDLDSIKFEDNDYSQSPGIRFFERSNTPLTLAQWQALPRHRDQ